MTAELFDAAIEAVHQHPQAAIAAVSCAALLVFSRLRRKPSTLELQGPPSSSWFFGVAGDIFKSMGPGPLYVAWSKVHGTVFKVPLAFGDHAVVIMDPKAIATFFTRDTTVYGQSKPVARFLRRNFGENVLVSEGEDHKRQRRALSSGFSIAAIRKLTPIFLKSAYQVNDQWKEIIETNDGSSAIIDVQHWINGITLDSIGNGGFSHDFEATKGRKPLLQQRFEAFGSVKPSFAVMVAFLLSGIFPILGKLPTKRNKLTSELSESIRTVALELFEKAKAEKQGAGDQGLDKSILGALLKSENASVNIHMDLNEIMAQISLFMIAGYETTAVAIVWSLVELARYPDAQRKLRDEIANLQGEDPTYEQLSSGLPYLDAVVCETLRLHPSVPEVNRQANVDDVLPLTNPIVNEKGETMDSLPIPAGTKIRIPLSGMNLHEDFWGEDSRIFNPSRWLDETSKKRSEQISGFRHLLTFADGPRMCLGRLFALTEFKAVLATLIREYSFELPKGPETKIAMHRALTPRPKVEGEDGPFLPMIVRRVGQ